MKSSVISHILHSYSSQRLLLKLVLFVISFAFVAKIAISAEPASRAPQTAKNELADREASSQTVFEQMESEAIGFVKEHHPELVSLLQLLKAMKEKEYDVAIRDIDRARKRLEILAKRALETYQIELDSWKIQSKIDLLLAKGFAHDKAFNTRTLRSHLKDQVENQKKRLKNEQADLAKRQQLIVEQLEKLEGHESERVDQQFAALMKRVDAKVGKPTSKPKPEPKPAKEAKEKS